MSISISVLLPQHIHSDEVRFNNGVLQCSITVDRDNREQEDIGYANEKEVQVESALAHPHGPTVFELDAEGDDVDEVLKLADAHFRTDSSLKQKYPGAPWSTRTEDEVNWEGQSSILVGRCDGTIVGIVCLRMHCVGAPESPDVKFLNIGIGPFFVPPNLRGRAHAIEMSIAASYLSSVLLDALYLQMPKFGRMGVVVASDVPDDTAEEVHPFVDQIFQKILVTQEMLAFGGVFPNDAKWRTITFYPPRLER